MPTTNPNTPTAAQMRRDDSMMIRAAIADTPSSINVQDRSVEVIFGSDTPVPMWINGERALEVLSFDAQHADLTFLNAGASVLDNHSRWGSVTENVVGAVIEGSARVDGRKGYCRLRFATTEMGEKVWQMVKERTLRWVSVGYRVTKYIQEIGNYDLPMYRAIEWSGMEVSMVPVPADSTANVRGDQQEPTPQTYTIAIVSPTQQRSTTMDENQNPVAAPVVTTPTVTLEQPPAIPVPADEGTRAASTAAPAPAPVQVVVDANGILTACRAAGLDIEFAQTLINEGLTVPVARERALAEWERRGLAANATRTQHSNATANENVAVQRRAAIEGALMNRIDPNANPLSDGARAYRGLSLLEIARTELERSGIRTEGWTRREVAEAALGISTRSGGGAHSTSDFPLLLGNTVNRTLRAAYDLAPRTFTPFTRRTSAVDFREMTRTQLGEASGFDEVKEGGEYKRGTATEAAEKYKVVKYGKIFAFTWELLVNDDLGAFSRFAGMVAAQAAQKQSDIVWAILTGNPVMSDSVALFHATHGNLAGAGTAITVASLAAGRIAMRKQTALDAKSYLNISPSFLLVGPNKELEAYQFTSSNYVPTKNSDINPVNNTNLSVIVEPRITDNAWLLAATPGLIDTVEYAFLEGDGELFTEQRSGFDVDGIEIKARMVFGAKAIDWRGLYRNPGA